MLAGRGDRSGHGHCPGDAGGIGSRVALGTMGLAVAHAATLSIAFGLPVAALGRPGALLWAAGPERSDPHLGNGHESR